ncbi:ribbon-helix-helix protein, CopG family [Photorhabdus sp. APURE]|nr:ribbon-helix-helix protein, CopG family [Photorhabdus aballayi]MCW7548035.1 ribbon-helix-helix protein, CopG family [Photorhabdus aballayi]
MATSVKLDDNLKSRFQYLAEVRHRSAHWIMRESFKQDALRAWEAYREDGLHLTLEEADDWLAKLEAGEDAELPECHV